MGTTQRLKKENWFLMVISFTLATLLVSYIPENSPLILLSYTFGFIFISFVPGYCFLRLIFPKDRKIDIIEGIVLSVVLSYSITGLIGLLLGLTPIGLSATSVRVSLALVTVFFATLNLKRAN
jgi:uncharacterized membrane protein